MAIQGATFKQVDLERAIRAVQNMQLPVAGVVIEQERVTVLAGDPSNVAPNVLKPKEVWVI